MRIHPPPKVLFLSKRRSLLYRFGFITLRRGKRGERRIKIVALLKEAGAPEPRICENDRGTNNTLAAHSAFSAPRRYSTKKLADQRRSLFTRLSSASMPKRKRASTGPSPVTQPIIPTDSHHAGRDLENLSSSLEWVTASRQPLSHPIFVGERPTQLFLKVRYDADHTSHQDSPRSIRHP